MSTTFVIGFILIQIAVFGIVILVLRRLMYRDTLSAVNRLRLVDEENIKRVEEMKEKIRLAEEEYHRKIEQTVKEIREQREKFRKEIEDEREKIISAAWSESERIITSAKKTVVREDERRAKDVEAKARIFALQMLKSFFSERLAGGLDEQLIKELIDEIKTLDAERLSVDFDEMGIITRLPLAAEHKAQIKKIMETKTGRKLEIKEEIKEDMVGGIILKLGSLIVDGSMESKVMEAAEEMKRA